jgi:hypothetical protein
MKIRFVYGLPVFLIFCGAFCNPKPALPWGGSIHTVIAQDAYGVLRHVDFPEANENASIFGFWDKEKFDGFQEIKDFDNFVWNAANFSKRFIKFDNSEFYKNSDYYQKVMEPLWAHTVNDVVDLWLTVFYQGLGEQRYNEIGFPKRTGARDAKELDYPDVELVKD